MTRCLDLAGTQAKHLAQRITTTARKTQKPTISQFSKPGASTGNTDVVTAGGIPEQSRPAAAGSVVNSSVTGNSSKLGYRSAAIGLGVPLPEYVILSLFLPSSTKHVEPFGRDNFRAEGEGLGRIVPLYVGVIRSK